MDEGKLYRVVYQDPERTRVKDLIYLGRDGALLKFRNPKTRAIEYISENVIVRIEQMEKVKTTF